jgi:hypothetical protein
MKKLKKPKQYYSYQPDRIYDTQSNRSIQSASPPRRAMSGDADCKNILQREKPLIIQTDIYPLISAGKKSL